MACWEGGGVVGCGGSRFLECGEIYMIMRNHSKVG